jgi:hypothetical protein
MKKIIVYFLGILLALLLVTAGILTYAYSQSGNARIQAYLERTIVERTGLPVRFHTFRLTRGHLYFVAVLGREASLGFDGKFDVLHRRIDGRYLVRADHFRYQQYTLRQARLGGHIAGTPEHIDVDGNGTLLGGAARYSLTLANRIPKDIVVKLRDLPLEEVLALVGEPQIASGKIDADIKLPAIGEEKSRGHALVQLVDARFDADAIAKLYHYKLPADRTDLQGEVRADLAGEQIHFSGNVLSDLITIRIQNGQANIADKSMASDLTIDSPELAPVTQKRLHGPLKLVGTFKYDTLGVHLRARTDSLGGKVVVDYTKNVLLDLRNVSLAKVLRLVGQPDLAEGQINGKLTLDSPQTLNGRYVLRLRDAKLHSATLNSTYGTALPSNVTLKLDSRGTVEEGKLNARTRLVSNLLDATLSQTRWNLKSGKGKTRYRVHIPNPLALSGKSGKGVPVTLVGLVEKDTALRIEGDAKGLGKKLTFVYAGDRLKIDGSGVAIGRLLASAGQPVSVSGKADVQVDLTRLDPLSGTVRLKAPQLKTHPKAIAKLLGKPIDTTLSLLLDGQAKNGTFYGKGALKSPLMTLACPKIVLKGDTMAFSTPYRLKVPDLAKLQPLLETKLNGTLDTRGTFAYDHSVKLEGDTASLGGTSTYRYRGSRLDVNVQGVALPKLLHMMDQPDQFDGTIDGTFTYDTDSKNGKAHIIGKAFRFKPGTLTAGVKLVLQKDLSQIIYDRATFDARIRGDHVAYKLIARGRRSTFAIRDGKLNTQAKTNSASFGLRIDDVDVIGTIKGSIDDPKVRVLPGRMLRNRLKKKVVDRVAPAVGRAIKKKTNSTTQKLLNKLPKLF